MYENDYSGNYNNVNANSSQTGGYSTESNTYHYDSNAGNAFHNNSNGYNGNAQQPKQPKKHKVGNGGKIALGICCGLLFGIFAGVGFEAVSTASDYLKESRKVAEVSQIGENQTEKEAEESVKEVIPAAALDGNQIATTTVTDVTQVVKSVMPAMVSVNNKYIETTTFWGRDYSSEGVSTGSGIIVGQNDTELLIVTNFHVVEAANELMVQFVDGKQVQAQMKGSEKDKDLAVIAVQLKDIESDTMSAIAVASMGDSTELEVGEPVIAIGNALGYGQSVSTGVVSALDRPIAVNNVSTGTAEADSEINTFIQTDAAINPGNSGGALLNIKGEVVGINSNKIGGSVVEGMGYAIPISDAEPIIEDLMTKETKLRVEETNKGYLGITGIDVMAEYAEVYGMPRGVYISSVTEGTGAAEAGLIRGDIITAINGEEVVSMDKLKDELSYYAAGDTVELTIMQGSPVGYQSKTVSVTLGAQVTTQ